MKTHGFKVLVAAVALAAGVYVSMRPVTAGGPGARSASVKCAGVAAKSIECPAGTYASCDCSAFREAKCACIADAPK
jgi:hypothetical protein